MMRNSVRFAAGIALRLVAAAVLAMSLPATAEQAGDTPFSNVGHDPVRAFGEEQYRQAFRHWQAGNYDQTLQIVRARADQADPLGQLLMGNLYAFGTGVTQDDEQAVAWWQKAARQGLAPAQNELGVALTDGRGIEPDPELAAQWYRKAADQGLAVAQVNLGLLYVHGRGVPADVRRGVEWFAKAADQQLGWAQYYLGNAYATGRGVERDDRKAVEWYGKAAAQEYTDAQYALAVMYRLGRGVDRSDESRTVHWLAQAARLGHEPARADLRRMQVRFTALRLPRDTGIRVGPEPDSHTIRTARDRERAFVLNRGRGWLQVYLEAGHVVGYIDTSQARR